jgi:hypothetical protein
MTNTDISRLGTILGVDDVREMMREEMLSIGSKK